MNVIAIIGFVLTIIATILTVWQAVVAVRAAKSACAYRDEIIFDRRRSKLAEAVIRARNARKECLKLGTPADSTKPLRGVNEDAILDELVEMAQHVREQRQHIQSSWIEKSLRVLDSQISNYKQSIDRKDRYKCGDALIATVSTLCDDLVEMSEAVIFPPVK